MEHDLIILVRRVQGVSARGVRCRRRKRTITIVCRPNAALRRGNVTPEPNKTMVKCGPVLLLIVVLLSVDPVS